MASQLRLNSPLVGQPELRRVFQLQVYEAIAQRLNLHYHLPPMDREETGYYVAHHLKMAGVASSIFTDDAVAILDLRIRTKWYGRCFRNALPRCCEISSLEDVDV